jgi:thiamine pyrophosphokinase
MKKCVIIGAGECDINDLREISFSDDDIVIAADGGYDYAREAGVAVDLFVGDMDSVIDKTSKIDVEAIVFPSQKDDTDMLLAIKEGIARGFDNFFIYGGLGHRLDHTMANIACLEYIVNHGKGAELIGLDGIKLLMVRNGCIEIEEKFAEIGRTISVFAYGGEAKGVKISGLKYEVSDITLSSDFPLGVSNEFVGKKAFISVREGVLLIYIGNRILR